jgi:MYXO-CTERM domain-containing protein
VRTLRKLLIILLAGVALLFGVVFLSGYAMRNAAEGDESLLYLMMGLLFALLLVLRRRRVC